MPATDESNAHCKVCNTDIRAHFKDLKDHSLPSVNTLIVPMKRDGQNTNDHQKCRELRIATYVACHTSINAVDDLTDILQDETRAFKMHRIKCTTVIK